MKKMPKQMRNVTKCESKEERKKLRTKEKKNAKAN
jgi:hypothetical protein